MALATARLLLALPILGFASAAFAQEPPTFPGELVPVGNHPVAIAGGDLDKDGMTDFVTANRGAGTVSVCQGNGAGRFTPGVEFPMGTAPVAVALGDLDKDGLLDVAVADVGPPAGGPGFVWVRLGVAVPTPQPPLLGPSTSFFCGFGPTSLALADVNGDGKLDAIVGNTQTMDVAVLFGVGGGVLGPPVSYSAGGPVSSLGAADFTGDGIADVVATVGVTNGSLALWMGNPGGMVALNPHPLPPGITPFLVSIADVTGDGKLDLAAACKFDAAPGNLLYCFFNTGSPANPKFDIFAVPVVLDDLTTGMVIQDVNGDGQNDLLTVHKNIDVLIERFGTGPGIFGGSESIPIAEGETATVNGVIILPVTNHAKSPQYFPAAFDKVALAMAETATEHAVDAILLDPNGQCKNPAVTVSTGYICIAPGDLNSDGLLDLAAARPIFDSLDGLQGDGTGKFTLVSTKTTGIGTQHVALGDLNGDGKLDAVVTLMLTGGIEVALGNGAGGFGSLVFYSTGGGATSSAIADLDADGRLDVATANVWENPDTNNVTYRYGTGGGALGASHSWGTPTPTSSLALGRLNGDAYPDIVANGGGGGVAIGLGSASGFGAPTLIGVGGTGAPSFLALADLSKDSKLDLVTTINSSNTLSVLLNNGAGGFGAPSTYFTGYNPLGIATGDFDVDGNVDVATGLGTSSGAKVCFGSGSGLSDKKSFFHMGGNPVWIASGDFDGNGAMDLVGVDSLGIIRVLLNQHPMGPFAPWFGAGTQGCGGQQSMNALGDVKVGNSAFQLHSSKAPASSLGLGLVGQGAIPTGADSFGIGVTMLVDLFVGSPIAFDVFSDAAGEGYASVPIPNSPWLSGSTFYVQTLWLWSECSPSTFGLSSTGAVALAVHD